MITSPRNAKIVSALRLKKRAFRERERRFLVEGAQAVSEALGHPRGLLGLFHTDPGHPLVARAADAGVDVVHVGDQVMGKLTSTVTPQGMLGVAGFVDVGLAEVPEESGCIALLHEVRDPGNAGTVLRSADAVGAGAVVFTSSSVDVYNPKTVRATAGSLFHLPLVRGVDTDAAIEHVRGRGMHVLAMDGGGEADLYEVDLTEPVAFVFGNEARGLPRELAGLADATVRVPLGGRAESLNLAAAASVCLFEWARRQREGRRAILETIIAAAAHDIRSPLTAMKGFGHALSGRWDQMTEEQRQLMLTGIVFDTDRLNSIVRQLVDAARLAAGSLELFPARVDIGHVVEQVAESLGRDPDHPAIRWGSGQVVAFVDPERLRLVLEAFIESLVWWTNEGPVLVRAERRDGRLRLEVARRGTELAQEDAERLFRPRAPGTGAGSKIGLFVALGIAAAQGGTATVRVEDGLTFVLDIEGGVEEPPA
ncbi:MAG TPA: TrmH family RNA methyltransferase [Actinomycetota bacterium]|nr:TrmH family RNA methyltransferase [Actinomycetota bacterium]